MKVSRGATMMTSTTVETIRGGHGAVSTWAKIVDGEFEVGGVSIQIDGDDKYLPVRNPDHLLDVVAAAQELHAAITERTADA